MTTRTVAQGKQERRPAIAAEIDLDFCANTFGVSPCTAGRKDTGTAQAGAAGSITLRAGASAVTDFYKGMVVRTTGGTGPGQERTVTAYNGATKVATITPNWTVNPDGTTTYNVIDRPNACYNTFYGDSPCQDQANYVKTVKTIKLCSAHMPAPVGEQVRPYIAGAKVSPTVIDTSGGLAQRSKTELALLDEPTAVDDLDPYLQWRTAKAGGQFITRLVARNPNAVGRFVRVRKGYITVPFDWTVFQTELYVVETFKGPDSSGQWKLVLADPIKILDRVKLPLATDGKLVADVLAQDNAGSLQSATSTTAVLAVAASSVDSTYNGEEIFITGGLGAGQRRVISSYVGISRTATVPAWTITPDSTSAYEIVPLKLTVTTGKGAQYTDPSGSGKNEYVRVGDEVIRYTAKAGDVLSWPDGTYRAQFSTTRADHKVNDGVQLCRAWLDKAASETVENILNEGGLVDTYIDLTALAQENTDWLANARITVCIADPTQCSELLTGLLMDLNMLVWWDPVQQKVRFKVDMPSVSATVPLLTDAKFMYGTVEKETLDSSRITRAALDFALGTPTLDRTKRSNYRTVQIFVDTDAESAKGYGDVRDSLRQSRWLGVTNLVFGNTSVNRRVLRLRDAPSELMVKLDPKDEVLLGQLVDVQTRKMVKSNGQPKTVRCRVVQITDNGGDFDVLLRTTTFAKRYAFIAPPGFPDYPGASDAQRAYAFIADGATGLMSDGSSAYLIL